MRAMGLSLLLALVWGLSGEARAGEEISVERGLQVSIIGGCHDCHTEGYFESEGKIDPQRALKGSSVGWQGPWGTSYPGNLRLDAADLSEDGFVRLLASLRTLPPMPWYNVRAMDESDLRSLYQYIRSLGEPGNRAPAFVPPGEPVKTRYIGGAPHDPPACTRDLDCGVDKSAVLVRHASALRNRRHVALDVRSRPILSKRSLRSGLRHTGECAPQRVPGDATDSGRGCQGSPIAGPCSIRYSAPEPQWPTARASIAAVSSSDKSPL